MVLQKVRSLVAFLVGSLVEYVLQPVLMPIVEADWIPDWIIRIGIRVLLARTLQELDLGSEEKNVAAKMAYVDDLKTRRLAESTDDANKQHYEVPSTLYDLCLGPWKKYSCGLWPAGTTTLEESEVAGLSLLCDRAQITNTPMHILDMGCGWGSVTLYIATHYPNVRITAMSNSRTQKEYIDKQARERGLTNVEVITCDINNFAPRQKFDLVVSVEMMEHVKNYRTLLASVASWMKPNARFFVHIFTHKKFPFHYVDGWMARNFFTGGQMPSDDLLLHFQEHLTLSRRWVLNGNHYAKTCEAWLQKFDANKRAAVRVCGETYGKEQATKWFVNWRLFFLACAELFAFRGGEEWQVSHYLFEKAHGE